MRSLGALFIVFVLFSCSNDYEIEDELMTCLKNKYTDEGINLEYELKAFEEVLLDGGEVKESSGLAYFNLYQDLLSGGKLKYITSDHFETKLNYSIGLDTIDFQVCIDHDEYKSSKSFELDTIVSSFILSGSQDSKKLVSLIRNVLDEETLNHPYFKAKMLILITSQISKEQGMFQLLPTKELKKEVDNESLIKVLVNEDGDIFLNEEIVAYKNLSQKLKVIIKSTDDEKNGVEIRDVSIEELQNDYFKSKKDTSKKGLKQTKKALLRIQAKKIFKENYKLTNTIVSLKVTQKTSYKIYLEVKDSIKEAYKSIRIDLAQKYLGKTSWEDLSLDEKEMLKLVVKERISEKPVVK